jgi:predicted transcriptional regulator
MEEIQAERRQNWVCNAHGRMEEKIDIGFRDIGVKLDDIVERQLEYIERLTRIEDKQGSLEKIVTNGLSHNVVNISKRLDVFCEEVKKRLDELEEFQWFRKPITAFRDGIFIAVFKVAMIGALIYTIIHFGKEFFVLVLK